MVTGSRYFAAAHAAARWSFALLLLLHGEFAFAKCNTLLPRVDSKTAVRRPITTDDLVRLRTIGTPDASAALYEPSPLAVSPDGRYIAFVLSQADPVTNGYCRALVVIASDGAGVPRIVDKGGEPIVAKGAWLADLIVPNGAPVSVTPVWSPDGRWIAYLRQEHGIVQAWRVRADGTDSAPITHRVTDVESLAWSVDGRKLIFAGHPGQARLEQQIEEEGGRGWLYDARIVPLLSPRPRNLGAATRIVSTLDFDTGTERVATAVEAARLSPQLSPSATTANGKRAWLESSFAGTPSRLVAADDSGRNWVCTIAVCDDAVRGLWWDEEGRSVTFLRREGWAHGQMALYRWTPGAGAPRRLVLTDDVLLGCVTALSGLICTRENVHVPRQLVRVDLRTGASRPLFEPNPEFRSIALATVTRLRWRDAAGGEAWADLVFPRDDHGSRKLPMIVVQYHSLGFLRGGTGDEYPIYPFAAHGFAVLSIEEPAPPASSRMNAAEPATGQDDWPERRRILDSLVTGVRMAIARGVVDPHRIGITGLSDGATSAKFALLNTGLFAAAAISQSTIEPKTVMTYAGTAFADRMRARGYPAASLDVPAFWRPMSFALNAGRLMTPVLMQVSQDEYLGALESFAALREHDAPAELYVFPDEHHVKWQPSHRKAVYDRSIDWFDFWLRSHVDPDPSKGAQYARWQNMRERLQVKATPPGS